MMMMMMMMTMMIMKETRELQLGFFALLEPNTLIIKRCTFGTPN